MNKNYKRAVIAMAVPMVSNLFAYFFQGLIGVFNPNLFSEMGSLFPWVFIMAAQVISYAATPWVVYFLAVDYIENKYQDQVGFKKRIAFGVAVAVSAAVAVLEIAVLKLY